jgi:hypothetical protein
VRLANRDGGVAMAARLAAGSGAGEYAMFIDDQTTLAPGAIDRLVELLDAQPAAYAATPASAPAGTAPLIGTLFRTAAHEAVPFADGLGEHELAEDWALRAGLHEPGRLASCPDATIVSERPNAARHNEPFAQRAAAVRELESVAEFSERHGRLPVARLAQLVPELVDEQGELDEPSAELLLAHVRAQGPAATLAAWMNGGLDPLFGRPEEIAAAERIAWLEQRSETLAAIESGGWWQLRGRLEPLFKFASAVRR